MDTHASLGNVTDTIPDLWLAPKNVRLLMLRSIAGMDISRFFLDNNINCCLKGGDYDFICQM
jgi:hypothetical protein